MRTIEKYLFCECAKTSMHKEKIVCPTIETDLAMPNRGRPMNKDK